MPGRVLLQQTWDQISSSPIEISEVLSSVLLDNLFFALPENVVLLANLDEGLKRFIQMVYFMPG